MKSSGSEDLLLSIITPIHDEATEFADTVACMPGADKNIEWLLVQDGVKPMEELSEGRILPEYARVITGDGKGATDAVNKGITQAKGEFCLFLMSDDLLLKDAIPSLLKTIRQKPTHDLLSVGVDFLRDGSAPPHIGAYKAVPWNLENMMYGRPCLGGRIFKKTIFDRMGLFDTKFTYCSDREYLGRLLLAGTSQKALDIHLYRYRIHKGSETMGGDPGRIARYLALHIEVADLWSQSQKISSEERAHILRWQDYETARLIYYCALSRLWKNLAKRASLQFMRRPLWPFRALLARAIAKKISLAYRRLDS